MKKTIACTLSICAISAVLATGCVKKDINNSKTEIITSTTAVKEQTTTTLPEIVTTAVPKKEPNYDNERIKVTKWDMLSNGERIPLEVTVEDVTY